MPEGGRPYSKRAMQRRLRRQSDDDSRMNRNDPSDFGRPRRRGPAEDSRYFNWRTQGNRRASPEIEEGVRSVGTRGVFKNKSVRTRGTGSSTSIRSQMRTPGVARRIRRRNSY